MTIDIITSHTIYHIPNVIVPTLSSLLQERVRAGIVSQEKEDLM